MVSPSVEAKRFIPVEFEDPQRLHLALRDQFKRVLIDEVLAERITTPADLIQLQVDFHQTFPDQIDLDQVIGQSLGQIVEAASKVEPQSMIPYDRALTLTAQVIEAGQSLS